MPPFTVVGDDLAGIGVFADFRIFHRADREEAEIRIGVIDDLVRRIGRRIRWYCRNGWMGGRMHFRRIAFTQAVAVRR